MRNYVLAYYGHTWVSVTFLQEIHVKLLAGSGGLLAEPLRNYESLATTDEQFSFWNYHNGDIGWSEHPCYVDTHNRLLNDIIRQAPYAETRETVQFLKSLKARS